MASALKRGATWYAKVKWRTGQWKRVKTSATSKGEALRIGFEIEKREKRIADGKDAAGDAHWQVGDVLLWWLIHVSARQSSHLRNVSAIRKHLAPQDRELAGVANKDWLDRADERQGVWRSRDDGTLWTVIVANLEARRVESFLLEKDVEVGAQTVNHLRGFLSRAFNAAIDADKFKGPSPIHPRKAPKRRVPKAPEEYLLWWEVRPTLAALEVPDRLLFGFAIYTGMRKGELFNLERADGLQALRTGWVPVRGVVRANGVRTAKGGDQELVPLADEARVFLQAALDLYPTSRWVFPMPDGRQRREDMKLSTKLRGAMKAAGLAAEYVHVCRKKGCGHEEAHADAELRHCPVHDYKLWPKAKIRPIRFHDLRHTTASLLLQSGATLAFVQRVLRHKDPKTTMRYAHLAGSMHREINRLRFYGPEASPQPPGPSPDVAASAVGGPQPDKFGPFRGPPGEGRQPPGSGFHNEVSDAGQLAWCAMQDSNLRPSAPEADRGDYQNLADLPDAHNSMHFGAPSGGVGFQPVPDFTNGLVQTWSKRPQRPPGWNVIQGGADDLLTVREVADRLSLSTATVYAMIEAGELAHRRVRNTIRVRRGDVAAITGGSLG